MLVSRGSKKLAEATNAQQLLRREHDRIRTCLQDAKDTQDDLKEAGLICKAELDKTLALQECLREAIEKIHAETFKVRAESTNVTSDEKACQHRPLAQQMKMAQSRQHAANHHLDNIKKELKEAKEPNKVLVKQIGQEWRDAAKKMVERQNLLAKSAKVKDHLDRMLRQIQAGKSTKVDRIKQDFKAAKERNKFLEYQVAQAQGDILKAMTEQEALREQSEKDLKAAEERNKALEQQLAQAHRELHDVLKTKAECKALLMQCTKEKEHHDKTLKQMRHFTQQFEEVRKHQEQHAELAQVVERKTAMAERKACIEEALQERKLRLEAAAAEHERVCQEKTDLQRTLEKAECCTFDLHQDFQELSKNATRNIEALDCQIKGVVEEIECMRNFKSAPQSSLTEGESVANPLGDEGGSAEEEEVSNLLLSPHQGFVTKKERAMWNLRRLQVDTNDTQQVTGCGFLPTDVASATREVIPTIPMIHARAQGNSSKAFSFFDRKRQNFLFA